MASKAALRKTRKRLGESQEEFAPRFGVDQGTYSRWETKGIPKTGSARITIEYVLANLAIQHGSRKSAA